MNKFRGFLFLILILLGCKEKTVHLGKEISFDKRMNISYGVDAEQKLDLYIPKRHGQIKNVFIIVHGGGWRGGDKSELTFFTLSLMQKFPESVFANINYRLASSSRFALPNQTDDVGKAISFLEKTLEYKLTFILLGNSAGGHLSMLYAYKVNTKFKVKAVVNIVGPSDLSDPNFKNYSDYSFVENQLVNPVAPPACISKTTFASPTRSIHDNSPPTISFYGNNDQVIPSSQKSILDSVLSKNSVYNKSFEFSGGHLDWDKEKNADFLLNKIDVFLKQIK
ncbi:alpha/beta hydrolase [Chryseobacterium chendengshani]|uniref:alpha/beta hydrolase n=1 Tax=Chryseobacterium sp. LJ756 TaxID=2864113 RepID=UPI001C63C4E1|nr:alpha/beta hydrolase [Chryseobacterium sp. LJ756]MBW7676831.1 alpha/beta hydrolase [Chryseobacterium sp. LJ756]